MAENFPQIHQTPTPAYETAPARQLEVSHTESHDFALNRDAALAEKWGDQLKATLEEGIPSSWTPIGGGSRNVMAGEIAGKCFVAKLRSNRLDEGDGRMTAEEWDKVFIMPRQQVYAHESILNELQLAPEIKSAVANESVQEAVRHMGFKGLSFIEPIMGVVSRSPSGVLPYNKYLAEELGRPQPKTEKFLVYEHIEGSSPAPEQGRELEQVVSASLLQQGIRPGDLRADHFLVDTNGVVHLLDTEQYTPMPQVQ